MPATVSDKNTSYGCDPGGEQTAVFNQALWNRRKRGENCPHKWDHQEILGKRWSHEEKKTERHDGSGTGCGTEKGGFGIRVS